MFIFVTVCDLFEWKRISAVVEEKNTPRKKLKIEQHEAN